MYDYNDNVQLAVTYELNRDLRIVRRSVYSFLDLLGEIGGLAGALHAFFSVTIIIFQFRAVTSYLSQHLYLIREGDDKEDKAKDKDKASNEKNQKNNDILGESKESQVLKRVPISFFASIKLSLQRLLCKNKKRCQSRRDRLSHLQDQMVTEELRIVNWIQHMRCMKLAMQKLFTKEQWAVIEKEAKFRVVSLDRKSDEPLFLNKTDFQSQITEQSMELNSHRERHIARSISMSEISQQSEFRLFDRKADDCSSF